MPIPGEADPNLPVAPAADEQGLQEPATDGSDGQATDLSNRARKRIDGLLRERGELRSELSAARDTLEEMRSEISSLKQGLAPQKEKGDRTVADLSDGELADVVSKVMTEEDGDKKERNLPYMLEAFREIARRESKQSADSLERKQRAENVFKSMLENIYGELDRTYGKDVYDPNSEITKLARQEMDKIRKIYGPNVDRSFPHVHKMAYDQAYKRIVAGDKPLPTFLSELEAERRRNAGGIQGAGSAGKSPDDGVRKHLSRGDAEAAVGEIAKRLTGGG